MDFKRKGGLQAVFVGAERAIWISRYPAFFNKLNSLDIFAESMLVDVRITLTRIYSFTELLSTIRRC